MIDVTRDLERMRDYAVGRLSDEESRAFEERLVREPELVREVEESLRLREGLEELRARGRLAIAAPKPAQATSAPALRPRSAAPDLWIPTLAAATLVAITLILLLQPGASGAPLLRAAIAAHDSGGPNRPAQIFTFLALRGAAPDLALPATGAIEFRAAPALRNPGSGYRVTLAREAADGSLQALGSTGALRLAPDGYVHSYVDAARLTSGRYSLQVEPEGSSAAQPQIYEFILRAPGAPARE